MTESTIEFKENAHTLRVSSSIMELTPDFLRVILELALILWSCQQHIWSRFQYFFYELQYFEASSIVFEKAGYIY